MGFWIFMLIISLLIPLTMATIGRRYMKKPPKNINNTSGYRTEMSMKNKDTWDFAHKYIGKLWFVCGLILIPISVFPLIFILNSNITTVSFVGIIIVFIQIALMLCSVIPTERALRKAFTKDGLRK